MHEFGDLVHNSAMKTEHYYDFAVEKLWENEMDFIIIDGILQLISKKKRKIFHFIDKLSLHNMAASSGLRENVYPINFFLKCSSL